MYQYDSKSKTQSKKSNTNTPVTNKEHTQLRIHTPVQTKSLFSASLNQENDSKKPISGPAQLMPQKEQNEIPPPPIKRVEEQGPHEPVSIRPNNTGIPMQMKEKFESLSGFSFEDVRVHYNSEKPAQLRALAYTQGSNVYIAPGQEKSLGHELGHVVQQKQGQVQPTLQLQGVGINEDAALEREADLIGEAAQSIAFDEGAFVDTPIQMKARDGVVQRITSYEEYQIAQSIDESWYYKIFIPAITTEARRKGETYRSYIEKLTEEKFHEKFMKLHSKFKVNFTDFSTPEGLEKPKQIGPHLISIPAAYPNCYNVLGTNILISKSIVEGVTESTEGDFGIVSTLLSTYDKQLKDFINSCLGGTFVCYRGISVTHFSWDSIRTTGVVASEGSEDVPTFTIADASGVDNKTRWLPFAEDKNVALSVARKGDTSISTEDGILNGAIIEYTVTPNTPIAWLTGGEVSIRGPIVINNVTLVIDKKIGKIVSHNMLPPAVPFGEKGIFAVNYMQLIKEDRQEANLMKLYGDFDMERIKFSILTEIEYELRNIKSIKDKQDIIKSRREYFDTFIAKHYTNIIREGGEKSQYLSSMLKTLKFI